MAELSEVLTNGELVTSVLGAWPSFHDAEILSLELRRKPDATDVTAQLTVKTMPYEPSGKPKTSLLVFLFKGVDELELFDFNNQNVLYSLTVEREGDKKKLAISPAYGLAGKFGFTEAEVLRVESLD